MSITRTIDGDCISWVVSTPAETLHVRKCGEHPTITIGPANEDAPMRISFGKKDRPAEQPAKPVSQWERAGSFVKTIMSGVLDGMLPDYIIGHRWQCCTGMTLDGLRVSDPCVNFHRAEDGHSYCKGCGCGEWKLARLDGAMFGNMKTSKLAWPGLECPLKRFTPLTIGASNG